MTVKHLDVQMENLKEQYLGNQKDYNSVFETESLKEYSKESLKGFLKEYSKEILKG